MVSYQQKVKYVKTTSDLYLCYTFIIHRAVENYNTCIYHSIESDSNTKSFIPYVIPLWYL